MPGMTDEGSGAAAKADKGFGKLLLWAFVGFPLLIAGGCTVLAITAGDGDDQAVTDGEVRRQCETWVEDQLKAPATADFTDGSVTADGASSWTVTGAVDAENSFGALVRSDWTCDIRLEGDTWRGRATLTE